VVDLDQPTGSADLVRMASTVDDRREMEDAAAMLADDPEMVHSLITDRFPFEDAVQACRVTGTPVRHQHPRGPRTVGSRARSLRMLDNESDLLLRSLTTLWLLRMVC
jgi:hypothetical protein